MLLAADSCISITTRQQLVRFLTSARRHLRLWPKRASEAMPRRLSLYNCLHTLLLFAIFLQSTKTLFRVRCLLECLERLPVIGKPTRSSAGANFFSCHCLLIMRSCHCVLNWNQHVLFQQASVVERPLPECHQRGLHWLRCELGDPYALSNLLHIAHSTVARLDSAGAAVAAAAPSPHLCSLPSLATRRERARSGVGAYPPVLQQRLELERVWLPHAAALSRVLPAGQPHARLRLLGNDGHRRHDCK